MTSNNGSVCGRPSLFGVHVSNLEVGLAGSLSLESKDDDLCEIDRGYNWKAAIVKVYFTVYQQMDKVAALGFTIAGTS